MRRRHDYLVCRRDSSSREVVHLTALSRHATREAAEVVRVPLGSADAVYEIVSYPQGAGPLTGPAPGARAAGRPL